MINFKINNIDLVAENGETIYDAAKKAGISIPVLCHRDGVEHYSSCMVCLVKEKKSDKFIPSCSALIQEGMDIDTSGDEVINLRKKSVELLLSEHRAECEAPCRVVCPEGYNIPLLNRYLAAGLTEKAVNLTLSEVGNKDILCKDCPGYCENACRRKKIDMPVSIRNIKLFISESIKQLSPDDETAVQASVNEEETSIARSLPGKKKRFLSHIGKIEPQELKEWLKECENFSYRSRSITDFNSASGESKSCMHCDCRAADDCRLRDLADEFLLKDPRGKLINAPIFKKINQTTGLVFENAKCIKCGLCVRICEDSTEEPVLCFTNRGFISIISEPLTEEFDNVLKVKYGECINICPTGALSHYK
jgi:NADH dehydrogenase/NADH:ubiquinone oxidoreductase subunit G